MGWSAIPTKGQLWIARIEHGNSKSARPFQPLLNRRFDERGQASAVELIAAAVRDRGEAVTSMQLDYVLWNRGQEPAYKARPRHRTRTVFY